MARWPQQFQPPLIGTLSLDHDRVDRLVLITWASVIFPVQANHSFAVICSTVGAGMLSASPETHYRKGRSCPHTPCTPSIVNREQKMLGDKNTKCLLYHTEDDFLCLFSHERACIVAYREFCFDLQTWMIENWCFITLSLCLSLPYTEKWPI